MGSREEKTIPPAFGRRVQRERERRGLSLRDLAAKAGTNASTILRAENGQDLMLSTAIGISRTIGISLDSLLAKSSCDVCDGSPPAGFLCTACKREGSVKA